MNYGLPYQGSKNKIAEWVVGNLPKAEVLVDLFAGGCAITHCAMLSGKYQKIIANDISGTVQVFYDAIHGEYRNYSTIPTREEFFLEKDNDKALAILNSFGNNCTDYAYNEKIENLKVLAMRMIALPSMHERRIAYRKFIAELKDDTDICERSSGLKNLQSLESLERLERLQRLQSLERIQSLESLNCTQLDYRCVQIPTNSIVYADPPYRNTGNKYGCVFDFETFDKWLSVVPFMVVVSEYIAPGGCVEVARTNKICAFAKENNNKQTVEKLFVQERFADEYKERMSQKDQTELFRVNGSVTDEL